MSSIKALGLITLKLEAELEQSWDLVRKASHEANADDTPIKDKRDVTQENVSAFMSAIEMKVAQLLMDSGNDAMPPSLQM